MSRASLPQVERRAIDSVALRAELAAALAGAVRFERLDRALSSTDASVYPIVPAGVVFWRKSPAGNDPYGERPL